MMKNNLKIAFLFAGAAVLLTACQPSVSDMTELEADRLTNPSRTIPPEALQGMANMDELVRKQHEANQAAGVDSRGIPLAKSTEPTATAPQMNLNRTSR